ncbi:pre-rRNA-processing protein esf1, partial [Fagus crenata]
MIWIETLNQFPNENSVDFVQIGIEESLLRYYYAVVECDSSATADYLYKSCDGTEFERSSNKLDLRFISDSMEFKHPPRAIATE